MAAISASLWELTEDQRKPQPRDDGMFSLEDARFAQATLEMVQVAMRTAISSMSRRHGPMRDKRPLTARRLWLFALLRIEENGEPKFTNRKLARITQLDEALIRRDHDLVRCLHRADPSLGDYIENVCEHVETGIPLVAGASMFMRRQAEVIDEMKDEKKPQPAKPAALPSPTTVRNPEIDAIMEIGKARRAEVQRRIDLAVIANPTSSKNDRRAAAKRLGVSA